MKIKDFVQKILELNPDDDTKIELLLVNDRGVPCDFLDIKDILWNQDCLGYNEIGIVLSPSQRLELKQNLLFNGIDCDELSKIMAEIEGKHEEI